MEKEISLLQKKRLSYQPRGPSLFQKVHQFCFQPKKGGRGHRDEKLRPLFPKTFDHSSYELKRGEGAARPLKVGALFSGGQAAGGHNVLAGLFDCLHQIDPASSLVGFLGGPAGILKNKTLAIGKEELASFRNQGGFDLIGSGRTKIETQEQLEACLDVCQKQQLDGLLIIGGDDSNTNAAILAEFFLQKGAQTRIVGVPKTIDGDLRSEAIEITFGFDSACKTYAELIGNIARDALSAKKYYHFIKLMGRSASHIALECALATHPNLVLISEEQKPFRQLIEEIVDLVCRRSEAGKEYGICLIPEGLIEFIPEMQLLIAELNKLLVAGIPEGKKIEDLLTDVARGIFCELPGKIQTQLAFDRDPHGNVNVSLIETEQLLIELVKKELKKRSSYKGKFSPIPHFFGYEGRSCLPSNFDANYAYALGALAALAIRDQLTGVICAICHLNRPPEEWLLQAIPIVQMMHLELRKNKEKPVIRKTIVDVKSPSFKQFDAIRKTWKFDDCYRYSGPIQFFGDPELTDAIPFVLRSQ